MTQTFVLRLATPNDYDALGEVMFDAVRNGNSLYSEHQRQAWVPFARTGTVSHDRLSKQTIFVAEVDATIVGFMSLTDEGYIDLAFIRPIAQKSGLFRRLFQSIEAKARELSIQRLWVHASLMAQPAFSAMGFEITLIETVEINGERFERFAMEKRLLPDT